MGIKTWQTFSQGTCIPNFKQIGPAVLEKISYILMEKSGKRSYGKSQKKFFLNSRNVIYFDKEPVSNYIEIHAAVSKLKSEWMDEGWTDTEQTSGGGQLLY